MTKASVVPNYGCGWADSYNQAMQNANRPGGVVNVPDPRTSEQVMVDMIRADLGVAIDPQAWRMFIRHRFERISPLAHRIHDGKR